MPQLKRLVLNFPGFETTTAVHQIERLTAGGHKTAALWEFELSADEIEEDAANYKTVRTFHSHGPDWSAETRYVHFSWADIIAKYENVPYPKNLINHLPGYLAFFFDRTVLKYRKASARYWGFTIYPILLLVLFAVLAWFAAGYALSFFASATVLQFALTIALFLVLCKFPGDKLYVMLSVNDWAFARDMCLSTNPEIEARYDAFATHLLKEIRRSNADEIIIVGHSFGSVWAVMALAKALERRPKALDGKRITFLAMGSSLLKVGLVKKAQFLSAAVQKVLSLKHLLWHEIQTKTDFVSFYKSDPFEPMGIKDIAAEVILHRVNFKKALSKQRHRKMLKSMYLAHRQYILYCDRKVHHDFQLRVLGPHFADELARNIDLVITEQKAEAE